MHRLVPSLLATALLVVACADERIPLSYGLEPGRRLEYRLELRADIERTLSGSTRRQEVRGSFRTVQEIVELLPNGGARARMALIPESLSVDGAPTDPGRGQEFTVQLGPDGRVVAIEEATGQPTEPLEPVGLERLLPRLRPVLPGARVSPGDSWSSRSTFDGEDERFSIAMTSRLDRLGVTEGRAAALVRTTYESPVDARDVLANAVADLRGRDVGAQEAWFALDGFLLRATGDSVGRYAITFLPPEEEDEAAPVEGSLVVRLHTEMRLRD